MVEMQHLHTEESLTATIVDAVADREDVRTSELPPLYETVDGEALDALFDHSKDPADSSLTVNFQYAGFTVTVGPDRSVTVE